MVMPCGKGLRTPMCLVTKPMANFRNQFKGYHAELLACCLKRESSVTAACRRWHGDEGRVVAAWARKEFQHRLGDDAERAFAADEKVAQVISGVVLAQCPQAD